MEISDNRRGQHMVVAAQGELNMNTSESFTRHCQALIKQGERSLALDFSKVKYLSSAGLRAILILDRELREAGGTLVLCGLSEPARMTLTISGMLSQLKVHASAEELE